MPQITAAIKEQWPIPTGLSRKGRAAAKVILEFLAEKELTEHGGGGKFYSPKQWAERGELYGRTSELVITHDGGDHAYALDYDREAYALMEELRGRLQPLGMYIEQCTCWYSAVYQI